MRRMEKQREPKNRIRLIDRAKTFGTACTLGLGAPTMVFAAGNSQGMQMMQKILDAIIDLFPIIGVVFIAAGAFKLINGFRNDNNPEAIAGGAKDLAIGVALIIFKALIWENISGVIFS